jgi:hypothetical protein
VADDVTLTPKPDRRRQRRGTSDLKVVPFNPPAAKDDGPKWETVRDMLVEALAKMDSGEFRPNRMILFYGVPTPEGGIRPGYWTKNVGIAEKIAYGQLLIDLSMREWRDE